jgi:hypothetical protein
LAALDTVARAGLAPGGRHGDPVSFVSSHALLFAGSVPPFSRTSRTNAASFSASRVALGNKRAFFCGKLAPSFDKSPSRLLRALLERRRERVGGVGASLGVLLFGARLLRRRKSSSHALGRFLLDPLEHLLRRLDLRFDSLERSDRARFVAARERAL